MTGENRYNTEEAYAASHARARRILDDPEAIARLTRPPREDVEPMTGAEFLVKYRIGA